MLAVYQTLTTIFYPLFIIIIYLRKLSGKEDPIRFKEKIFFSPKFKILNKDNLIWFHGASIGEIQSIVPIINRLIEKDVNTSILISSVTLSSGKLVEEEFKKHKNIYHYYFPLDIPYLINKFLNEFKPKMIGFIDSEIWPNFICEIKKRKIPLILINGRITKKTFKRWKYIEILSNNIFSSFDLVLASSKESLKNLINLNCNNAKHIGNIKFVSNIKKNNTLDTATTQQLDKRKVWCAASTHKNEEVFCLNAHLKIKKIYSDILTIIIPRHIHRINYIFSDCQKLNLKTQIINKGNFIKEDTEIILINSFGVLNQYFEYCKSVFIGKSMNKKLALVGGQNPLEAARLGCKIYHGPYVYNFEEIYNFLNKNNITEQIFNSNELSAKIIEDLKTPKIMDKTSLDKINLFGDEILRKTVKEMIKFL